jgi:branched-chain amino acid transport system substrate-binding protein
MTRYMSRSRRLHLLRGLAVTALCVFGAATITGASVGAPAANDIVIGVNVPLSGGLAANGSLLLRGYQLAIDGVNAKGGVAGHKLRLDIQDDQGNPTVAVNAVTKLARDDGVEAVLGSYGSSQGLAVAPILERYKIPNLQPFISAPSPTDLKYFFDLIPLSSEINQPMFKQFIPRLKPTSVGMIYTDTPNNVADAAAFKDAMAAAGAPIADMEKVSSGSQDFLAAMTKIQAAKPQLLVIDALTPDTIVLYRELKQFNIKPKWLISLDSTLLAPAALNAIGKDVLTVICNPVWWGGVTTGGAKQFAVAYSKKYKSPPTVEAAKGYQAAQVLVDALKRAKNPTSTEDLTTALHKTNLDTVAGHVKFGSDGRISGGGAFIVQFQTVKGKSKLVSAWPPPADKHVLPFRGWTR